MRKIILAILLSLLTSLVYGNIGVRPLPSDQAFVFSTFIDKNNQLVAEWAIAPGYYLYRNKINFTVAPTSQVQIGEILLPQGEIKKDQVHGMYQAYSQNFQVRVPLKGHTSGKLNLNIGYQGCSSAGFCYSPIRKNLSVDLAKVTPRQNLTAFVQTVGASKRKPIVSDQDYATRLFAGQNLFVVMLSFMGLGLLLAFTPCVLPMVPILSGIIVGHGKKTNTAKAFLLSLAYVSGMALTYAIVGIVIALIGDSIQAGLQKPWVIVLFSGLFVLLALSLFGFYELQLPQRWRQLVDRISRNQKGGTYLGVFCMGSLSTLIVSPCVSAPLVGVLAYIGQTGDVVLGGLALLALGIGMGVPLLLIGMSADKFLPKAGPWMRTIERIFGLMMLGIAIWMLSRMIPGPVTLFLWAILLIFSAIFLEVFSEVPKAWKWLIRVLGVLMLFYAAILMIGVVLGNSDPLNPWEEWEGISAKIHKEALMTKKLSFTSIHNLAEFDKQLAKAQKSGWPVMLDFYADWCVGCVVMDREVFSRADVEQALAPYVLLRVDLTDNSKEDQQIMKHFQVIGPPTMLFFDRKGQEINSKRIVGEVHATEFLAQLNKM